MNFFRNVKDGVIAITKMMYVVLYILLTALVTTLIIMSPFMLIARLLK